MAIDFVVTVHDDGVVRICKLQPGELLRANPLTDTNFEAACMEPDDSIKLHVDTTRMIPTPFGHGRSHSGVKRMIQISVLDDEIPQFTSQREADLWMEARRG